MTLILTYIAISLLTLVAICTYTSNSPSQYKISLSALPYNSMQCV